VWFFGGVLTSVLCYFAGYHVLYWIVDGGRRSTGYYGGGAVLVFGAYVLTMLVAQIAISVKLRKKGKKSAVLGVWAFYPIVFLAYEAVNAYLINRTEAANRISYASHELLPLQARPNKILIESTEYKRLPSRAYDDSLCDDVCIFVLKSGLVDSIAMRPHGQAVRKFHIYRYGSQSACKTVPDKEKLRRAYRQLNTSGYFDGCILRELSAAYDYDARIVRGKQLARPYGPCCEVAEFFERQPGGETKLGRWEAGRIRYGWGPKTRRVWSGEPFDLQQIFSVLLSRPVPDGLPKYPFGDRVGELERLLRIIRQGIDPTRHEAFVIWIIDIYSKATMGLKGKKIAPSDAELQTLSGILRALPPGRRNSLLLPLKFRLVAESYKVLERIE